MRFILPLLFLLVPIVEIALLIAVGQTIGLWPTLAIVIGTAILGTIVISRQGFTTLRKANEALAAGKPPVDAVVDGMFLFIAGALLLSPGLLTDALGFLLLIPPVRTLIVRWGARRLFAPGVFRVVTFGRAGPPPRQDRAGSDDSDAPTIDGEFERLDERSPPRRR